jgi:ribosomal protein S18 acetylase RimI-like enzyme
MLLRDATTADADLLAELLLDAYNWTGEVRMTREAIRGDPHALRYLAGWQRPGDVGLVMVDGPDPGSAPGTATPVGAIWARALPASAPGYGYVADDVPELSMAVRAPWRGRGVGSALLTGLVERGRASGWRGLSLSVEDGNDAARRLYERHGFRVVGRTGGSDTMLLDLHAAAPEDAAPDRWSG